MKIVIFSETYKNFMGSYVANLVNAMLTVDKEVGSKIILYGPEILATDHKVEQLVQSDLGYLSAARDPRLYEGFLSKLVEVSGVGFICRLTMPEFLYSELTMRLEFQEADLMFSIFNFELASKSVARARVLMATSELRQVRKIFVHGVRGFSPVFPKMFKFSDACLHKVSFTSELDYTDPSDFSHIEKVRLTPKATSVRLKFLYFGNMFYGKGLQLLLDAIASVSPDHSFVVAGDLSTANAEISIPQRNNLTVIDGFVSELEMARLFRETDVVVMPYRSSYEFGTSGVFHMAMLASKPVLVPDISPFSDALEKFSVGVKFRADSSQALVSGIQEIAGKIDQFDEACFERYRGERTTWSEFARLVLSFKI